MSIVAGGLIGYERASRNKDAGMRTHAVLCLSTCALTCLSELLLPEETPRVISGMIQGVSFICAGVIIFEKSDEKIKGLTSSVILWLDAIIGIIIASDYWLISIPLMVCYGIINIVINPLDLKARK